MNAPTRGTVIVLGLLLVSGTVLAWALQGARGVPGIPARLDPDLATAAAPPRFAPRTRSSIPVHAPANDIFGDRTEAGRRSFDEWIDELVAMGVATWTASQEHDIAAATEHDEAARASFARLRGAFPDAHERALHLLSGLMTEDESRPAIVRRQVLATVIRAGLHELWRWSESGSPRAACDRFVSAMLLAIPQDEWLAIELGQKALAQRPYLGVAHEAGIMDLVEQAATEPFLAPVARALLLTLWKNLESSDARASARLASLAMVMMDAANPSQRAAALQHLVSAEDGRFIDLVVQRAIASGDRDLVRLIATTVACELEPSRALEVLDRLNDKAGGDLLSAYMRLGARSTTAMREHYEQRLADGATPAVRAALISGAGFGGPAGVEVAQLAFDQDPDPTVRSRALIVLGARAAVDVAERALLQAIGDEVFTSAPDRLGDIVVALRNLAGQNAPNAVDRIAQTLFVHPRLAPGDRHELERIVRDFVPGGGN